MDLRTDEQVFKVPLSIREKLPPSLEGVRVRYQASEWITERGLINEVP